MQGLEIIVQIVIILMSVVIHEVSHGWAAQYLGDPTAKLQGRLTLNPLKHLDPIGSVLVPIVTAMSGFAFGWAKPVPYNPYNLRAGKWGPAIVAAAGPLSNLAIALIFGILLRILMAFDLVSGTFVTLASLIVVINILLMVVNLIPVPPIDGSKILFAILPPRFRYIEDTLKSYGLFIVLGLLVFFMFGGFIVLQNITLFISSLILGF